MSSVYTAEDFSSGRVPSRTGYESAVLRMTDGLTALVDRQMLFGAVFVGSVTNADFQVGSDIDLFVVLERPGAEEHLRDLSLEITDDTYVHFDIKAVHRSLAERGRHNLLSFYVQTTKEFCKSWTIGQDPTSVVVPGGNWGDPRAELIDDLTARAEGLIKARLRTRVDYGKAHCALLDRVTTLPIYAAINMVRLDHGAHPRVLGKRVSKAGMCQLYAETFPRPLGAAVSTLLAVKQQYRAAFGSPRKGVAAYRKLLADIDAAYVLARNFIEDNCALLHDCPDESRAERKRNLRSCLESYAVGAHHESSEQSRLIDELPGSTRGESREYRASSEPP